MQLKSVRFGFEFHERTVTSRIEVHEHLAENWLNDHGHLTENRPIFRNFNSPRSFNWITQLNEHGNLTEDNDFLFRIKKK